ncbi:Glucose 1-dehydrogenase 1 [compost metagenome]|jgi:NAD(P)-dependent dehydrogenase (short-subunit alcohol dehydrogenase family)|uniref:2,5-dichloro-2,5-cyclohexadiene-1,4-diol dehydrogenase n=2 Tax=Agrobacterium tumefaciens complex TaxID=1183400 RepID=A0A1S7NS29_AGRTU|nr:MULTISPECIES: SDR family oxidoreductase [Agrobacterium tumefaciens complex]MCP2134234.1 NAD(P)-dependent dehydrogenase (short-subunit alcohol dehydrogenase family) [Rhizobium sp. SLBN-94]TGE80461.1 KR domain-containing protein [Rhizobium sp. SEMIA 439]AYM81553.1 short-chain dehydrogenase [Agrobacterium tumefaciens]KAA1237358.1 SDR family oxidoreductase [Agrobacterium tumefaciens]KAB0460746.1 SDR family oxidoreductase [Agrobacterium tumefaciens]
MKLLENKVAIITGASSGIGRATAMLFAAHGAAVVLNARGEKALQEVAGDIRETGGRVHAVAGDAGLAETHSRLAEAAVSVFGGLDIAVNNAGAVGAMKPLAEISPAEWDDVLNVNLTSAFLGARYQIPLMLTRGGGSIVFTSSFVGTSVGIPGMAAYGAAKAALMGLVKGITADYAISGIRANALLPGGVDTPAAGDAAQKEWAAGLHAMKRIAEPQEIAQAALFLASPMASFVAGAALFADGGNAAVK